MKAEVFRAALGKFATGVAVVTTETGTGTAGITINSFASLSLDPPLVLWSIDKASRRCKTFADAQFSAIHFLEEGQADIARSFTRPDATYENMEENAQGVSCLANVLARLDCEMHEVLEGGDHLILVSRVLEVTHREGAPLLFYEGGFAKLG